MMWIDVIWYDMIYYDYDYDMIWLWLWYDVIWYVFRYIQYVFLYPFLSHSSETKHFAALCHLEVTPSIASILQLERRRIKRAIFVGSVPWTLVTQWIQTPRITCHHLVKFWTSDYVWFILKHIISYNSYITYMLLYIICIFMQDIVCFQEIFWVVFDVCTLVFQSMFPETFYASECTFHDFSKVLLLLLESTWSALGLALVPFHGGLREDPVALLLGLSMHLCSDYALLSCCFLFVCWLLGKFAHGRMAQLCWTWKNCIGPWFQNIPKLEDWINFTYICLKLGCFRMPCDIFNLFQGQNGPVSSAVLALGVLERLDQHALIMKTCKINFWVKEFRIGIPMIARIPHLIVHEHDYYQAKVLVLGCLTDHIIYLFILEALTLQPDHHPKRM